MPRPAPVTTATLPPRSIRSDIELPASPQRREVVLEELARRGRVDVLVGFAIAGTFVEVIDDPGIDIARAAEQILDTRSDPVCNRPQRLGVEPVAAHGVLAEDEADLLFGNTVE